MTPVYNQTSIEDTANEDGCDYLCVPTVIDVAPSEVLRDACVFATEAIESVNSSANMPPGVSVSDVTIH